MVPSLGLAGAEGRRYRTRRMRINVPKPPRTFLEMDDLVSLTDAAGEQGARIADLRLHAATDAHFRIPDAKTEAGHPGGAGQPGPLGGDRHPRRWPTPRRS